MRGRERLLEREVFVTRNLSAESPQGPPLLEAGEQGCALIDFHPSNLIVTTEHERSREGSGA